MRYGTRLLAAAGLAAALLSGCGKPAADPNTIRFRFWGDIEENKIIEVLVRDFEAKHPGVRVKLERKTPDASYGTLLLTEFTSGKAPDVIFVSSDNVAVIGATGQMADLKPYLAKEAARKLEPGEKVLNTDDFYAASLRPFSKDGQLLAVPRDIAPMSCVYYNKDLFDQAKLPYPKDSWTWDDLRAAAIKLTQREKDGSFKQLGFGDDWNLTDAWILAGGGKHVDDYAKPARFTFAEQPALEALLFRWKLMQEDKVMPSSSDNQTLNGGTGAMFMNGNLAMFHSGIWKTPGFRKIEKFKWDIALFPHKKGVQASYWSGGSGYGMRKDVVNPDLCWELVRFLGGYEGQKRLAGTGLAQPAIKALAASPAFLDGKDPQNKKMLLACAERAVYAPVWTKWTDFMSSVYGPTVDPVWLKGYGEEPATGKEPAKFDAAKAEAKVAAVLKEAQAKANAKYFPEKAKP